MKNNVLDASRRSIFSSSRSLNSLWKLMLSHRFFCCNYCAHSKSWWNPFLWLVHVATVWRDERKHYQMTDWNDTRQKTTGKFDKQTNRLQIVSCILNDFGGNSKRKKKVWCTVDQNLGKTTAEKCWQLKPKQKIRNDDELKHAHNMMKVKMAVDDFVGAWMAAAAMASTALTTCCILCVYEQRMLFTKLHTRIVCVHASANAQRKCNNNE